MENGFYFFIILILCHNVTAQTWTPLGSGINGGIPALASYNGDLYAGGTFTMAGGVPVSNIAKWNGTSWSAVGTGVNGGINELRVYNGDLYAGGTFTMAGGVPVSNIAKWNGTNWSAVGTGVNGQILGSIIYNGDLYVSGGFTTAGDIPVNRIAKWSGSAWSAVGTGMNALVFGLAVYNGELYAGGAFTIASDLPVNRIAKWNGTAWSPLGTGMNSNIFDALASYNGELYAGGIFTAAGGNPASRIAKWNGTEWSAVGTGITGTNVRGLMVSNGDLIVGGVFTAAGGVPANNIAKWNGTSWLAMGLGLNSGVVGLTEHNGDLYASGDFLTSGNIPVNHIAKWVPPCLITASAGPDENLIFGYGPIQCKSKTAVVTNGTPPFTYNWTLDRGLLPGESITGNSTGAVTACLVDTAQLYLTVTDARNCMAKDTARIFVNDVRCFAGKNQKVKVCHKGSTICIDESAVAGHLAHGDYPGECSETIFKLTQNITSKESADKRFNIYPNPNNGSLAVILDLPHASADKMIRVINVHGQVVKEIYTQQNRINMNINRQGVYLVQIIANKQVLGSRLIIVSH